MLKGKALFEIRIEHSVSENGIGNRETFKGAISGKSGVLPDTMNDYQVVTCNIGLEPRNGNRRISVNSLTWA